MKYLLRRRWSGVEWSPQWVGEGGEGMSDYGHMTSDKIRAFFFFQADNLNFHETEKRFGDCHLTLDT
jgi:hypothetical protein